MSGAVPATAVTDAQARLAVECGLLASAQAGRAAELLTEPDRRFLSGLAARTPADRDAWLAVRRASLAEAGRRIADGSITPRQAAETLDEQTAGETFPCLPFELLLRRRGAIDGAGELPTIQSAPLAPLATRAGDTVLEAPDQAADTHPGTAAVPVRDAAEALPEGKRFGKYVLQKEVGRGGCGTVYRAWQIDLARTVAIKTLNSLEGRPEDVARFQQEARLAARLRHPHIATVYEVGKVEEQHYIAMEFIDGPTLKDAIAQGGLDVEAILRRVRDVARALAYAHAEGVIHRDIKPENIMIAADRTPRILDFGLARQVADRTQLTVSGTILGTPAYMSPEQANGETRGIDARTDVYSLGAVLYYSISGKPPFAGSSLIETVYQVIEKDPPALGRIRPDLPREVVVICESAMEKDRERRYAGAALLADDIDRWLAGEAIQARPTTWTHRLRKRVRKHPGAVAVACVAAVALAAGYGEYERRTLRLAADGARKDAAARRMTEEKQRREEAQRLFDQARFQRGKDALALLDRALEVDPTHLEALSLRVQLRRQAKDFAGAKADLDAILAVAPDDVKATLLRALLLDQVFGDQEAAMAEYDRLVGMKVQPEVGLTARGRAKMLRGDLAGAIEDFGEAIRANGAYGDAWANRGSALARLGRLREALRDLRHVAQIEPDNIVVYHYLGFVHHRTSDYAQAIVYFDQAIQRNPLYADAHLGRGRALAEIGRLQEAEEACRKASELRPQDAGPLVTLGFVQQEMGRLEEARATLERAIRMSPGSGAQNNLGLVYYEERKYEESLAELDRAMALNPKDPIILRNRARTLIQLRKYEEAVRDCDAALERNAWYPEAYLTRGWAQFWLRQPASAVRSYEKYIEMAPNDRYRLEGESGMRGALAFVHAAGKKWVPATDHVRAAEAALAAGDLEGAGQAAAAAAQANPLLWTPHLVACRLAVRRKDLPAARAALAQARDAGFPFMAAFLQSAGMDAAREDPELAAMAAE